MPGQASLPYHSMRCQSGGVAFTCMIGSEQAKHLRQARAIGLGERAHSVVSSGWGAATPASASAPSTMRFQRAFASPVSKVMIW